MHVFVHSANVRAHDGLHGLTLSLFQQIWSQSVNHNLIVQGLIVELLVQLSVALVSVFLLPIDLLESLHLRLLLAGVVLKH